MYKNINNLKKDFEKIKRKGWIKSLANDFGSVGTTLEKLLGIEQNCLEIPDYGNIEIKTKRAYSNSYTNLFNCTPTGPHYHEVERLKDTFGYPDKILTEHKVLNTSIYCTEMSKVGINFYFKLRVDREKQKIILLIFDKNRKIIESNVYWDFDILKEKLYRKLNKLAFIKALVKRKNKEEYFKYYEMKIYKLKSFDTFITLLESGIIRISFKLSIFKSGKRVGQIHDHGTSFNIKECDLEKLYSLEK